MARGGWSKHGMLTSVFAASRARLAARRGTSCCGMLTEQTAYHVDDQHVSRAAGTIADASDANHRRQDGETLCESRVPRTTILRGGWLRRACFPTHVSPSGFFFRFDPFFARVRRARVGPDAGNSRGNSGRLKFEIGHAGGGTLGRVREMKRPSALQDGQGSWTNVSAKIWS